MVFPLFLLPFLFTLFAQVLIGGRVSVVGNDVRVYDNEYMNIYIYIIYMEA